MHTPPILIKLRKAPLWRFFILFAPNSFCDKPLVLGLLLVFGSTLKAQDFSNFAQFVQECYFNQPDSVNFLNKKLKLQSLKLKDSSKGVYIKKIHLKLNKELKIKVLKSKVNYFSPENNTNTYKIIVTNFTLTSKTKYVIDEFGNIISSNSSPNHLKPKPYVDKIVNVIVY